MRRTIATAVLLALAGCGDPGGPRVSPDAQPAPSGASQGGARRPGRPVTGSQPPAPSPGKIGTIRP